MDERDIEIAKLVIGETEIQVEVPKNIYDLVSLYGDKNEIISIYSTNGRYIESMLKAMLPNDINPSTSKQIRFVRSIANTLSLEINSEIYRSSSVASKFINENIEEFERKKNEEKEKELNGPKYIKVRVKKVVINYAKKTISYQKYIKARKLEIAGLSIDEIAKEMAVKPKTIESYLKKHEKIESSQSQNDKLKYMIALKLCENVGYQSEVINAITDVVIENKLHLEDWFPISNK